MGGSNGGGGGDGYWAYYNDSTETHYLYDGGALIATFDGRDSVGQLYVNGQGGAVAVYDHNKSTKRYYFLKDQVGTTRVVVNDTGLVCEYVDYQPFGEVYNSYASYDEPLKFTGKERDAFQTFDYTYFGARYYEPKTGRFTSIDKAGQYVSGYSYCGNEPILHFDPDGNETFPWVEFFMALWEVKQAREESQYKEHHEYTDRALNPFDGPFLFIGPFWMGTITVTADRPGIVFPSYGYGNGVYSNDPYNPGYGTPSSGMTTDRALGITGNPCLDLNAYSDEFDDALENGGYGGDGENRLDNTVGSHTIGLGRKKGDYYESGGGGGGGSATPAHKSAPPDPKAEARAKARAAVADLNRKPKVEGSKNPKVTSSAGVGAHADQRISKKTVDLYVAEASYTIQTGIGAGGTSVNLLNPQAVSLGPLQLGFRPETGNPFAAANRSIEFTSDGLDMATTQTWSLEIHPQQMLRAAVIGGSIYLIYQTGGLAFPVVAPVLTR